MSGKKQLAKELKKEFKKLYKTYSIDVAKKKFKIIGGYSVILCRDYRFVFGEKANGYCMMEHNELSVLKAWEVKKQKANYREKQDLQLRYLSELCYLRKGVGA